MQHLSEDLRVLRILFLTRRGGRPGAFFSSLPNLINKADLKVVNGRRVSDPYFVHFHLKSILAFILFGSGGQLSLLWGCFGFPRLGIILTTNCSRLLNRCSRFRSEVSQWHPCPEFDSVTPYLGRLGQSVEGVQYRMPLFWPVYMNMPLSGLSAPKRSLITVFSNVLLLQDQIRSYFIRSFGIECTWTWIGLRTWLYFTQG